MRCKVYVTVVRLSVRPSVCFAAAWSRAADIDRQLPAPDTGYRSTAAGIRAAAAGSVMLRAEVRGSAQTCISLTSQHWSWSGRSRSGGALQLGLIGAWFAGSRRCVWSRWNDRCPSNSSSHCIDHVRDPYRTAPSLCLTTFISPRTRVVHGLGWPMGWVEIFQFLVGWIGLGLL